MKKALMGLLFSLSLFLVACGGEDSAEESVEESGTSAGQMDPETIYMGTCSSCHGGNLEGQSAPQLSDIGVRKSYDEVLDVIENGQGRMPGGMIEGEKAEVVAQWLSEKQ